ncbi:MAG: NFACT RNA binding domain-containing protein [Peptostreptococcaceae bacterium]
MALDSLVIRNIVTELKEKLVGGKIDKVHQPEEDEVLLNIRNNKENFKLVLSANSSNPRAYISKNYKKENPLNAPMFCMLLRKYVQSGYIVDINQVDFERIIKISVSSFDELKEKTIKDIYIEIMGRHSNIILVHNEKIIDSAKRIPFSISRVRQILPGQIYSLPPSQDKLSPLNKISFIDFKNEIKDLDIEIQKAIYTKFLGISPLISKEICYRSNVSFDKISSTLEFNELNLLYDNFCLVFENVINNNFEPSMIINEKIDKVIDFSSINLTMFNDLSVTKSDSISEILENYYLTKDIKERIHQRSSDFRKSISIKLDRLYKKLKKQYQELEDAKNSEIFKIKGELINTYVYMIEKGMESVEVSNYYDPDAKNLEIKLDKNLTPSQNSQRYFKKYNKLKTAMKEVSSQVEISKEEIEYLENILLSIENCENLAELLDIREELTKTGYIKSKKTKIKEVKSTTKPHEFVSSDGFTMFVGKNNKQNDILTLKTANNNDLWLHTKNIPGSHVIIKTNDQEVPEQTIYEGAILSSYFSKGRMSSKVPVDYTKKKNVKKPSGSNPGMVIYETNNTIYVTPSEEELAKIKKID